MKFTEILQLFKQGKSTARSHMKNLIEMAAIDGNFDETEYDLLKSIAKKNGISGSQLKSIKNNHLDIEFVVPKDAFEKFHQLYDLVHMMIIDKEVHHEEVKLCNLFAVKFGYERKVIDDLISTIKSNIEHKNSPKDTFARIKWMVGKPEMSN